MWDFLVSPAAAYAPIVISTVDRVLVSLIAGSKRSSMDTAVAAAVGVVMVGVNLKDFKSRDVFWIGFGEVAKRRNDIL